MINLTTEEKIAALRELTRGADDVYAARGPHEWYPVYGPLQDQIVLLHLAGKVEIGSYPLVPTTNWPATYWVAADFDGKRQGSHWEQDVQRAVEFLSEFDGCPCFVNRSRSGNGAHVRMLFKTPVPAYLARVWMNTWLEEAGVLRADDDDFVDIPSSFDRLFPAADTLNSMPTRSGKRRPGNLIGTPCSGLHAKHGGTLPISTAAAAEGDFEPDGNHWRYVVDALEARTWGERELRAAIREMPGYTKAVEDGPRYGYTGGSLPVIQGSTGQLHMMLSFCEFMKHMRVPGASYDLWVALATQLHRFGSDGHAAFHDLSSVDARYDPKDTDMKWQQTAMMRPNRCDTLVRLGFTCPHLDSPRCSGARAPAYFADHLHNEIL